MDITMVLFPPHSAVCVIGLAVGRSTGAVGLRAQQGSRFPRLVSALIPTYNLGWGGKTDHRTALPRNDGQRFCHPEGRRILTYRGQDSSLRTE